ncbi:hypothetical protein CW354_14080 [Marinicaulis flavus]|uniref:Uncharacterized protein n=1 Tax=Hyphococcus luteus TaxID=2058213 RepID=A0A2S7K3T4_9PROT|nr:hypothetical protein CW354_14080 [Marinicaulis flavus]
MRLPEFNKNDGVMTRRLFSRPENGLDVARMNENAERAVDAVKMQTAPIRNALMKGVPRLPDPDDGLRAFHACCAGERKDKPEGGGRVAIIACPEFVHGARRQQNRPAGEIVRRGKPGEFAFLNVGNAPPEPRKLGAARDRLHPASSVFSYGRELEQKENF